jgi:ADP-heptose:LPS heptosyltransferase
MKIAENPSILVIQTAFLGDVVLSTALLETLHKAYPQSSIHILVRKGNESLFQNHPFLKQVLVWDKSKQKIKNLIALIIKIRRLRFDFVCNCHRHFTSGLITAMSGAKHTSGFKSNPLSFLFSERHAHVFSGIHEIERNFLLIQSLLKPTNLKNSCPPKLYPFEEKVEVNLPFITITPASVWFTKQFPTKNWMAFIHKVPSHFQIYLLGGKSDFALCEEIATQVNVGNRVTNLAGRNGFLNSAFVMKKATMNFVNDSGAMHLASAVNAPVCAIFCSTVPQFGYRPLSDQSFIIETSKQLSCRPCGLHGHKFCPEGHFKCGLEIKEEQLLKILEQVFV